MPIADEFEFRRDTRSYSDTPDIRGFGMPDMNWDGVVNHVDLMMVVMFHLQQSMEDDGTSLIYSSETADDESTTMFAAASDAESGNTVAGTYNYTTGEYNISFM